MASRWFLLAFILAGISAEATAQQPVPPASPPPVIVPSNLPPPVIMPSISPPIMTPSIPSPPRPQWPPRQKLRVLSSPDWSDYEIYPETARDLGQEGIVIAEQLVGEDGIPRACRVIASSGHVALDEGTCALLLQIRYASPLDAKGKKIQASIATRIVWLLADEPRPFVPSGFEARLRLDRGRVASCELTGHGPFLRDWARSACMVLEQTADYYFAGRLMAARSGTIFVDLIPAGTAASLHAAPGRRLIASRRTEFELDEDGDPVNCRTPLDRGFGSPRQDHRSPCSFFMTAPWFEEASTDSPPRKGAIEISVFLER